MPRPECRNSSAWQLVRTVLLTVAKTGGPLQDLARFAHASGWCYVGDIVMILWNAIDDVVVGCTHVGAVVVVVYTT